VPTSHKIVLFLFNTRSSLQIQTCSLKDKDVDNHKENVKEAEVKKCRITNKCAFKDAMPVSFRSELFTSYILTIFKQ